MSGYTTTPNYGLRKPIVGADNDAWGGDLNLNSDSLDTLIKNTNNALANYLPLAGGTLSGALTLAADPTLPLHASTMRYTDTKLALAGGTMLGVLTLAADPLAPLSASTKRYTDTMLPLAGGTLTGNVTAPSYTLVNGDRMAPAAYYPNIAWGVFDASGALGPYVANDGSTFLGTVTQKKLLGTIDGSTATLSLASMTATAGAHTNMTQIGLSNGDLILPEPRNPIAWGVYDGLGNVGPHVRSDGTAVLGTVGVTKLLPATIDGSAASLSLAKLTVAASVNFQLADPRVLGFPIRITDSAGNIAFAVDDAGLTHATLTTQTSATISSVPALTVGNVYSAPLDVRMPDTTYLISDAVGQGGIALTAGGHAAFTPAIGMISGPAQQTVKRRTVMTQCAWNQSTNVYNEASGTTFHAAMTLDTQGFDAVRLVFVSDNGPGAPFDTTISAKVAVSAVPNDFINPLDPTGAASAWTTVTFNNNGLDVAWENQAGGGKTSQMILPAPTTSPIDGSAQGNLIAYTLSDWMPISSYDRTDAGGRWPILMVRMYGTGTVVRARQAPQSVNGFGAQIGDRFWWLQSALGDFLTDPTTFPAPSGAINGNTVLLGVQYYSRSRGISVLNIGDSIAGGTGGGPGGIDWAVRACLTLSTPQSPIGYFIAPTGIITGTGPQVFMANGEKTFDWMQPSIVCMETMSRNWPITQTNIDLLWQHHMKMVGRLDKIGGLPIFSDPGPNSSMTAANEPLRLQIIHRCQQAEQGGHFKQKNNEGELVTGSTPVDTFATYYSDDNLHPNGRGQDAYAAPMIKHLLTAIGGTNP